MADVKHINIGNNTVLDIADAVAREGISILKITALHETSPATSAHEVGTYLTYNNVIYSVKTAIAVGDTLIVDTNIEVADIPEGAVVYWEDDSSPSGQVQSDWNQTDNTQPDYIKNKPSDDVVTLNGNPLSFTTDSEQAARECVITFEPIQAGSGDPSPSNVRAISGYDKVELAVPRKNLFNKDAVKDKEAYTASNHTYGVAGDGVGSIFIPVKSGDILTLSGMKNWSSIYENCFVTSDFTYISTVGSRTGSGGYAPNVTVTVPNDAKYINICCYYGEGSEQYIDKGTIQLELGSTATAYEPYNPITDYSESLPETVYGGTLNVETGELVVDRVLINLNSSNSSLYTRSNNPSIQSGRSVFYTTGLYEDFATYCKYSINDDNDGHVYIYSNRAIAGKSYNDIVDKTIFGIGVGVNQSKSMIGINIASSDASNVSELLTWLQSNPIQVSYPLADSYKYTIHLTPAQVRLLQGNNVVTTNGTSIKLTYRNGELATLADVSSIAESVNALGEKVKFKKVVYTAQSAELIPAETEKNYDISEVIPSGYIPISVAADQYLSAANAVVVGAPFRKNSDSKWYIQVYNWYSQELSMQPRFYILCMTWE